MTTFVHKLSLRISLGLNVLLSVAVLGLGALLLWQYWETALITDARPKGAVVSLPTDTRIVSSNAPTIYLPKGTILQESTPQGLATLGKSHDRVYLLPIRTDNSQFTTNHPSEKSTGWITPYIFAASRQ